MPSKPPTHRPSFWKPSERQYADRLYNHGTRKNDPTLNARQQLRNSARWQRLRSVVMAANCNLCVHCQRDGRTTAAVDVHHIDQDLARFFDVANLEAVCRACHARLSAAERTIGGDR